ncbi:MAG: uL13 family ribosomal protein [Candidatus Nanohaloarchaea archaeon]|nr:uL13 family ribosomal protein [Candidatus Nanohaloarchaea archaeon]
MTVKIDAKDHVLGRLATGLVKRLKEDNEEIEVYNAGDAIIKGDPEQITSKYRNRYKSGIRDHGTYTPKSAKKLLRKSVKGMLPDNKTGREMLGRLKVYDGGPVEEDSELEIFENAREEVLKGSNFLRVEELAENLKG